jgi:hypothetical protein
MTAYDAERLPVWCEGGSTAGPVPVAAVEYRTRPDGIRELRTATHTVAIAGVTYTVPTGTTVLAPGWALIGTSTGISGLAR